MKNRDYLMESGAESHRLTVKADTPRPVHRPIEPGSPYTHRGRKPQA